MPVSRHFRNYRYRNRLRFAPEDLRIMDATGWTVTNTGYLTHTTGTTAATYTPDGADATPGETGIFHTEFNVTGMTTGNVHIDVFGTNGTSRTANGVYSQDITVSSVGSDTIGFEPSTGFDGTIEFLRVFKQDEDT